MNKKALLSVYLCVNFSLSLYAQSQSKFNSLLISNDLIYNADAVIRLDEMSYKLVSQSEIIIKRKRIVTVLNESGFKHVKPYVVLDNSTQVNLLEATIFDSKGNELKKLKQKSFIEEKVSNVANLYSEYKLLKMEKIAATYPFTVYVNYEIKTTNTAFIPGYYFIEDYGVSIEEASCRTNFDADRFTVKVKENNFNANEVRKYTVKGNITYSVMNKMALLPESLSPDLQSLIPNIQFSVDKFNFGTTKGDALTIEKLGIWYYTNIVSDESKLSKETISEVKNLVSSSNNYLEKAKLIYEYVQNNIEYVELNPVFKNYKPLSVSIVDKIKKADAKSMVNYTKYLLAEVGVESYFTSINYGLGKNDFDENFTSLTQANHTVLCIPVDEKLFWINYSLAHTPFNFVDQYINDRNVLVIKPTGGEMKRTPAYEERANYINTNAEFYITNTGDITGEVSIKSGGIEYGKRLHFIEDSKESIAKKYQQNWENLENVTINNFSSVNDNDEFKLTEKISLSASSTTSIQKNKIGFSMNTFNRNLYNLKEYSNRKSILQIENNFLEVDKIIIHIPSGYKLKELPKDKIIENKFGKFLNHFEKGKNNTIIYKKELFIKEGKYTVEDYGMYLSFYNRMQYVDDIQLEFVKAGSI